MKPFPELSAHTQTTTLTHNGAHDASPPLLPFPHVLRFRREDPTETVIRPAVPKFEI